jgi:glutaconate CoA-transferase subunit A
VPGPDKRCTEDEVVAELRSGMTIGIGGWGARRKPMAFVRALLRSAEGPDHRRATAAPTWASCAPRGRPKVVYGFVSLDSIPLEPHFRNARQAGTIEAEELDEGMFLSGPAGRGVAPAVPAHRAGLGSDVLVNQPQIRTVKSPYDRRRAAGGHPRALRLDVAWST